MIVGSIGWKKNFYELIINERLIYLSLGRRYADHVCVYVLPAP